MPSTDEPITVLDESECWQRLESVKVGRLVTTAGTRIEIFPVNFAVQRETLLFRTAEGTKLVSTVLNNQVAFEADDYDDAGGWSVVVHGGAELLQTSADISEAEEAHLLTFTPTHKLRYVRITPTEISGRSFAFGPAADTGWVPG